MIVARPDLRRLSERAPFRISIKECLQNRFENAAGRSDTTSRGSCESALRQCRQGLVVSRSGILTGRRLRPGPVRFKRPMILVTIRAVLIPIAPRASLLWPANGTAVVRFRINKLVDFVCPVEPSPPVIIKRPSFSWPHVESGH